MAVVEEAGFFGANLKIEARQLPVGVGVNSVNQRPGEADFRPWRQPLAIVGPVIPAGRQTLYRMGRDVPSASSYWLSWSTVVDVIRAFDAEDPTERTFFTGSGSPKWTDNLIGLAGTPYPTATRELAVPQPSVAPVATMNTDGPTGEARRLYYCYTWCNDIGWEGAPSPPTLAPLAKPNALVDLAVSEVVPAGNYGITKLRWYRTQVTSAQGDAEFFFLREYAIGASGMQDDGRELGTDVLPTDAATLRLPLSTDAKCLTYCWNDFAAAVVGKAVRFCEPGLVYSWPLGNEYPVQDTPIAQAAFAQRLLVLTTGGAELFVGQDPEAMDQKPLGLAPIVSARSLVVGETFCVWAADDGLWYYGTDGYRNLVANCLKPEHWRALVPSAITGYYCEVGNRPLYVGFYNDGTLKGFVIDPANPNGIYWLDKGYTTGYWDALQRKLFVLDGAALKQWDAGAAFMTAIHKGKVHRQVAHTEAEWIEIMGSGSVTTKVYTETAGATSDSSPMVERMSRALTRGESRLPDGIAGRDWQVEISADGYVTGLVIE